MIHSSMVVIIMSSMNPIVSNFGNFLNVAFPKGLLAEMIFADLFGGKAKQADVQDYVDVQGHLSGHEQHSLISDLSDPLNLLINQAESDVSFIFALFVVTRIQDPVLRQKALNATLQSLSNNGFGFLKF